MIDLDGKVQYSNTVSVNTKKLYEVSIFPNPFHEVISINHLFPNKDYVIEIKNMIGISMLKSVHTSNQQGKITINDLSSLPSGLYFIRVSDSEGSEDIYKLLKSK